MNHKIGGQTLKTTTTLPLTSVVNHLANMKFLIVTCLIATVLAEPPRFRPARFRLQRQELAPTTTEATAESTTEAADAPYPAAGGPYPPSGWKPSQPFTLPQKSAPSDSYGAPEQNAPYPPSGWKPQGQAFTLPARQQAPQPPATSYGTPDNSYGPPDNTYGAPTTDASETEPTDNPQAERLEGPVEVQKSVGSYYILLPNGELQRVEFMTENDVQNMAFTSRLQVRDRAPLFLVRL